MLTQLELKEILTYDPETGIFTRNIQKDRDNYGLISGACNWYGHSYYISISIKGKGYRAHRLAWLYQYGSFPSQHIDHIDGDGANNRISNLRDVSAKDNHRNKKLRIDNKYGIPGVCWEKSRKSWCAYICVNRKRKTLKYTRDFFEACCIRKAAEIFHGYHPNHGRR